MENLELAERPVSPLSTSDESSNVKSTSNFTGALSTELVRGNGPVDNVGGLQNTGQNLFKSLISVIEDQRQEILRLSSKLQVLEETTNVVLVLFYFYNIPVVVFFSSHPVLYYRLIMQRWTEKLMSSWPRRRL